MIEIKNLSLQRGNKTLFENANLTINPSQRIGLIGKNGAGKSSLFSLFKQEMHPDNGDIFIPRNWKIASVSQETPALEISALEYVLQGDKQLQDLENELRIAENLDQGMKQAEIHSKLDEIDAYTAPARAATLLSGLGFSQLAQQQSTKTFSGGWRMRLNLAQALMCRADLLLLDEPTNHLDLETVLWLEHYLSNLNSTQIIISHDRDFLNATTNQTVELNQKKLTKYGGNYDFYQSEKAQRLAQQQNAYVKQQSQIQHLQSFIDRFKAKATKATQAQSRIKALEKIERIAPAHLDSEFTFHFETPAFLPNPLIKLDQISAGYADKTILNDINLSLESGARYGLLGVNGSGKSTLIKILAGELKPISGQLIKADKLQIGYFAQHQLDALRLDQSPLWHIQRISPQIKDQDIRQFLGAFNFVGDNALQPIESFSGGEKARLALAILVWQKPNLLLLDEPTNHLDLDMRHALTLALQSFQGVLIVVSHDRSLLESTTDQFLVIENGHLTEFNGDLNDYRQRRLSPEVDEQIPSNKVTTIRKNNKKIDAQNRQERARILKPIQLKIKKNEQQMERLVQEKKNNEAFLIDENAYAEDNKQQLQKIINHLAEVNSNISELEEEWLLLQEALEKEESNYQVQKVKE